MEITAVSHVHSSWSYDGSWSLDELTGTFGRRGYRVVMMTEHDRGFDNSRLEEYRRDCARATSDNVFVLPGIEYSDAANRVHVLVWGAVPFLGEGLETEVVLKAVARHGGVAVLAHPGRKAAYECVTPEWSQHLLGIEVWNRKYDGWAPGANAAPLLQPQQVPFVGLDFHTRRQMFPLGMALQVDGAIDEFTVVSALKARRCAARAFGVALNERGFIRTLPVLEVAEASRRTLATVKRRYVAALR